MEIVSLRDTGKYDSTGPTLPQSQSSTQERRKLLKRTRSLAVITEDESNRANNTGGGCPGEVLGPRIGVSYDTSSLQHHRRLHQQHHQLIPRAKLIDRNSLKDRLSKSQQHLSDCYYGEPFGPDLPALRACQSRSVCGLYNSLPPPLDSLPDPLPYTRAGGGLYRGSATLRPDHRINILKWPESPRRYRSVQDLNSVAGLVEDRCGWPGIDEENRSLDCIYTQVKRKRKEHRSLDSILFEDDSDELEYFDVLNLLPLSNVRLEIDEPDNGGAVQGRSRAANRDPKSSPAIIAVSAKRSSASADRRSKHHSGARITEIEDDIDELNRKNTAKTIAADRSVTSFYEIAREKRGPESKDDNKSKGHLESCSRTKQQPRRDTVDRKESSRAEDNKHRDGEKVRVEETEDTKSLWISDNEEVEDMSRRPLVLQVVDSDMTKTKSSKKSVSILDVGSDEDVAQKENICENTVIRRAASLNKPDLINDHVHEAKNNETEAEKEKSRLMSVENAKNFFEKKSVDGDNGSGKTSHSKSCDDAKGSLGYEARSESSDLGLGSEVGSDVRRLSVDENTNSTIDRKHSPDGCNGQYVDGGGKDKNQKNYTSLTRSRSYVDSIECQDPDEPEFDHVRYKILKSHVFSKKMFNSAKKDATYDGLMQYLREYSFQDLLMDNNVVIIEPVRAEVDRKPSFNDSKLKSSPSCGVSGTSLDKAKGAATDASSSDEKSERKGNHFKKTPRQSSLRKHFFYQPIRVNRELNDEELPDPNTVRNVRMMFEETMKKKLKADPKASRDCSTRKSVSMKDLRTFDCGGSDKAAEASSRSRCSSRAKNLTRMFENLDKPTSPSCSINGHKDDSDGPRGESKARAIVQAFEARSNQTSPSNSNSSKTRVSGRYQHRQLHNWDAGSVSSGVSSDYPDTDAGSAPACTSSEDEELYYPEYDEERYEGHYVPPDVLKKIREYGTSVTYYGGKVVNTCNGPLVCPTAGKNSKGSKNSLDYIKFRLVKSNSCDSRLEMTGRLIDSRSKGQLGMNRDKSVDLRQFTIDETPSIEITPIQQDDDKSQDNRETREEKREPPVVIGLEPKKDESSKSFKADFQLGKLDDCTSINRFAPSALARWQINENAWKKTSDFGKMEFEEFEVLEDSLNDIDH
ncbi:uncharacterized protein LOC106647880 isoform X2 [Copidosoma floridanum]|uniref:uncharacterized protein LOC106647880 isoform X2 n=1 Tax=Copidosoma floridanum TaxID=29053 RepID=UPI0006C9571D|nr:uncharacterized protein LOC106647880 isoform X2 [Copidosoma floridanum]